MAETSVSRATGDQLKKLGTGKFLTVQSIKGGGGSLQARKLSSGEIKFYWRYTHEGAKYRAEIGRWDSSAPPLLKDPTAKGYSISAALNECLVRAMVHTSGKSSGGWPGKVAREAAASQDEQRKRDHLALQTLGDLLDEYCDHLERKGRRSHADARSIFRIHVKEAWPTLSSAPAASLEPLDVTKMLRRLTDPSLNDGKPKGRTANKLRSYLHAAYRCATDVDVDAGVSGEFERFRITDNPIASVRRIKGADRADKNPLSLPHLRTYWERLKEIEGVKGAALRLHLLTGGQRIEQFVKLEVANVHAHHMVLLDLKGQRHDPLHHKVVLIPAALKEVENLRAALAAKRESRSEGSEEATPAQYLVSTDGGVTHVNAMTMTRWAQAIAAGIPGFQLKRVRSGVETVLAASGVPLDVRGLLQSHGLTGVQRRHYDGHDYVPELTSALTTLWRKITGRETKASTRKPSAGLSRRPREAK